MPDTFVSMPDGSYVQIPENATPGQISQFKQKFASFVDKQGIVNSQGVSTYMPSENVGVDQKAVHQFHLNYLNTDNPKANVPIATAYRLANVPSDRRAADQQLLQMNPVSQTAILQRAHDIANENQRQTALEATPSFKMNVLAQQSGVEGADPYLAAKYSGQGPQGGVAGTIIRDIAGPLGQKRYAGEQSAAMELARVGGGMAEPEMVPTFALPYTGAAKPILGRMLGATVASSMLPSAYQAAKKGDYGVAGVRGIVGLLGAAAAAKGHPSAPIEEPPPYTSPTVENIIADASHQAELNRISMNAPLAKRGPVGRGASPVRPTLPLASEFDQSQPLQGAEGPPTLGKPPFKTTYQGTEQPSSTPAPEAVPVSPGEGQAPSFKPGEMVRSRKYGNEFEILQERPNGYAVKPLSGKGGNFVPKPEAHEDFVRIGHAPEAPVSTEQAPPSKGTGLKIKKGNQTGAFDTSIIKDAAEKAADVASRISASQIYGEKGMLRPGEMPEAFQNAANSTRDMFIRRGSFTNEIAPDTFRFTNMLDNAPKIAMESVDKISRSLDPMTTAMKDTFQDMVTADKQLAVGAKNPIYSDAQVKAFSQNPAIQAILPKYNAAVQRVYDPIRNAAGYGQTNRVGKYMGVYSPSIPEDQLLGASVGGGAPGTKPSLVLNKMPGESQFTGNAPSYLGSLEGAHEFRLSGAVRASLQRQIVKNGVREGVIQSVPDTYDGTMMVNGRKLEAYKFKLSSLFNGGTDLGRIGVADEPSYIMPKKMFDEIRPVFEKGAKPAVDTGKNASILSKIFSPLTMMKAQLLSTGELGAHAVSLPGIAGQATKITTGNKAVDALVNSIPMAKQLVRTKDMVGLTKFSKVDVADARILMAKAGVLKESPLADASSTLQRIIAEKKGAPIPAQTTGNKIAAGMSQPGGVALYGRRGLYNNIGTGIVKSMRAQGATEARIVDALSNLPNKGGTFTSRTQDFVERLLGPGFYSTGVASLKAGLNSMTPRNVAGGLALYTIVGKLLDEDNKAWYERNLLPGQFVRGKDANGKQMVWDAATFDRITRVQREVPGKMYQESQVDLPNETAAHKRARVAETGLLAGVNQLTRPAASGPAVAIGSYATGMLPYLQKSSDRWGPELASHPMAKLGPGKADWWKGLGEAVLPGAQVAIGDVGADYRGNSPEDKNLQWVNRILKTLGQQQGKAQKANQPFINAVLTEYGNKSGTIKGRVRASAQAEGQARAKAAGGE